MPLNENEKLKFFTDTVIEESDKIAGDIHDSAAVERQEKINLELKSVLSEAREYIYSSIQEVRNKNATELSKRKLENKKEYLLRKEKLIDDVKEKCIELINKFTSSDAYADYLKDSINKITSTQNESFILILSAEDKDLIDKIVPENKLIESIEASDDIKYGGFKLKSVTGTKVLNETFDDKLEIEIDNFKKTLGNYVNAEADI